MSVCPGVTAFGRSSSQPWWSLFTLRGVVYERRFQINVSVSCSLFVFGCRLGNESLLLTLRRNVSEPRLIMSVLITVLPSLNLIWDSLAQLLRRLTVLLSSSFVFFADNPTDCWETFRRKLFWCLRRLVLLPQRVMKCCAKWCAGSKVSLSGGYP